MSPIVENFPGKAERFRKDPLALSSGEDLVLARDGKLWVEYAPFDYIRPDARVVIVGVTPGAHQAQLAVRHLRKLLARNIPLEQAMISTKEAASFSGPMRRNLLRMLDYSGIPRIAGMDRAADFFKPDAPVHFTSMLRYPVYQYDPKKEGGRGNYSGHGRKPLSVPMLREMIDTCLTEEVRALQDAVWVALGTGWAQLSRRERRLASGTGHHRYSASFRPQHRTDLLLHRRAIRRPGFHKGEHRNDGCRSRFPVRRN